MEIYVDVNVLQRHCCFCVCCFVVVVVCLFFVCLLAGVIIIAFLFAEPCLFAP